MDNLKQKIIKEIKQLAAEEKRARAKLQKAETHDRKLARKLSAELNGDGAAAQRSSSSLREKLASLRRGLSDATNKLQQGL